MATDTNKKLGDNACQNPILVYYSTVYNFVHERKKIGVREYYI